MHVETTSPALDENVLLELVDEVGEETVTSLLEKYLTDAPLQLERMRDALERRDAPTVGTVAHTLKSTSALFGAQGLADVLGELETAGRTGVLDEAAETLARAGALFDAVRAQLALRAQSGTHTA
jgi:HPt (histidine-containing phosphotransfer) domain-containing protein